MSSIGEQMREVGFRAVGQRFINLIQMFVPVGGMGPPLMSIMVAKLLEEDKAYNPKPEPPPNLFANPNPADYGEQQRQYINYGATMFNGPNCTGEMGMGPYVDFGCTGICWPHPGAQSVLLEAKRYWDYPSYNLNDGVNGVGNDPPPVKRDGGGISPVFRLPDKKHKRVATEGPTAMVFTRGECRMEDFVGRAYVPNTLKTACVTFGQSARSFVLANLVDCPMEQARQPMIEDTIKQHWDWYKEEPDFENWDAGGRQNLWIDSSKGVQEDEERLKKQKQRPGSKDSVLFEGPEEDREKGRIYHIEDPEGGPPG